MKAIALLGLGLGVSVLSAVDAGAATLFDSGGFSSYTVNADLHGQDGWMGGITPAGANIGAGVYDPVDPYVVLIHLQPTVGSMGVWEQPLAPLPAGDEWVSVSWIQYVDTGGQFGVALLDSGNGMIGGLQLGVYDDSFHALRVDFDLSTDTAFAFMDGAYLFSFGTNGSKTPTSVALIAFSGQGYGYFDDLMVVSAVPEPGVMAWAAGSALLTLRRRRAAQKD